MFTEKRSFLNPGSQRGAALITALFIITILTVLGMLVLNTSIVETKMAANQKISSQVFYAAEAGLERGLMVMVADMEDDGTASGPWGNLNFPTSAGSVTAALVNGATAFSVNVRSVEMYRDGDNTSGVRRLTFGNGGDTVGNATYELYMYSPNNSEVYLLSYASGINGVAAVEYHLDTDDLSPYNNAVFSGTGLNPDGDDTMDVKIAGSIYSQGQVTLDGNSLIVNTYADSGCDSILTAMLPSVGGLDTKIRVKGGALTLLGDSAVGTANSNGAISEIQADAGFNEGTATNYVDDVGTGTPNIPMPGILDGLEAEHPGISSDPTYSGIGDELTRAMAIYKDLIRGLNGFAPGGTYADPNATVTSKGIVIDGDLSSIIQGGAGCTPAVLDIDCDGDPDHGDVGEIEIETCTPSFSCKDSLGNGLEWNATSRVMTFTGMVMVSDEFEIDDESNPVTYISMGAFIDSAGTTVAPANQNEQTAMVIAVDEIEIENSFTPDNGGYLQGGDYTNAIAFIAGEEIELEADEHETGTTRITGFFYTPGEFEVEDGVQVAGTLIGAEFELEDNPSICQVPALKNFLPSYMPGANSVLAFNSREWRRVY